MTKALIMNNMKRQKTKLTNREHILINMLSLWIKSGKDPSEIKLLWMEEANNKQEKYRSKLLFDRCYQYLTKVDTKA
jgi:hypothetical protein